MDNSPLVNLGIGGPISLLSTTILVATSLAMLLVILRFISRHVTLAGRASDDYVILYSLVSSPVPVNLTINIVFVTVRSQIGLTERWRYI